MANWIAPKTNWTKDDFFNIEDYKRIVGNLKYLKYLSQTLFEEFEIAGMVDEKQYYSMFYASEMNAIETSLIAVNTGTYNFDIGEEKTYVANGPTPDFKEFNRIEQASLNIFNTLYGQAAIMQRLAIDNLGRKNWGKRTHYDHDEIIAYRLNWTLGIDKGVVR